MTERSGAPRWMADLGGVYAKLHRATVLSEELRIAEADFRARSPWTVPETIEGDWHVFRAVIPRPAPLSLSVIMAEAVHELRSSLDHFATATARLRSPGVREVHFPATRSQTDFDKYRKAHGSHFTSEQLDAIERYQPFTLDREPLLFLRAIVDFDNEAKHEVVPPVFAFIPVAGFLGDAEVEFLHPERIENGTLICRCRPAPGALVRGSIDIDLAYGTPRGVMLGLLRRSTLDAIHYYVGQIIVDITAATPEWSAAAP